MKKFLSRKRALALILALAILCSAFSVMAIASGTEAEAFCNAVSTLELADGIEEREAALAVAETALADYLAIDGNKKTDSAVADEYAVLVEIKNEMFEYYVEKAEDSYKYVDKRANLDRAGRILESLTPAEFTAGFRNSYNRMNEELREPEETSALFVARAVAAKEATTYAEAKKNYDLAKQLERNLELEGYPGISDAKELLSEVRAYLSACSMEVTDFLVAVEDVYATGNFFDGVAKAYEEYAALSDTTVEGVPEAKATLDEMVSKHDRRAKEANEAVDGVNSVIYGLLLGDEKNIDEGGTFVDWVNRVFG